MMPKMDADLMSQKMTDEQVEVNATTLVVAGAESIATAMLGTTFLLAKNQEKFDALAREVRLAFSSEEEITMMAVQKLPYLSAAINEGLRMFPPTGEDLPRVVRPEGDIICGVPLPGGVRLPVIPLLAETEGKLTYI